MLPSQVESTKQKLMALHDTLNTLIESPQPLDYPTIHSTFNTLVAKYESLTDTLQSSALLKSMAVVPRIVPSSDPDMVPRVLLKTRVQESIITDEASRVNAFETVLRETEAKTGKQLLPVPPSNALDQQAIRAELKAWTALVDAHDEVVNETLTYIEESGGLEAKESDDSEGKEEDTKKEESISPEVLRKRLEETVRFITFGTIN